MTWPGVPPKIVLEATGDGSGLPEFVFRLGRVSLRRRRGGRMSRPVATVAGFGILPSEGLDTGGTARRDWRPVGASSRAS